MFLGCFADGGIISSNNLERSFKYEFAEVCSAEVLLKCGRDIQGNFTWLNMYLENNAAVFMFVLRKFNKESCQRAGEKQLFGLCVLN